jgi:VWFA-related protein
VFVGRSDLGVGFTNDAGALARAADRIREAVGFGVSPVNEDAMDATSRLPHARSAVWTLKNVTTAMAASTHPRRTVVFVSGGVSLGPGEQPALTRLELQDALLVFEELEDVYEAARRANVRVYTLDPRGLVTPETAVRSGLTLERAASVAHVARRIRVQHDYLSAIALNTGGRAALNRSNLTEAIEEIVAENGSFYLLGYYPDPFRRDGKFHAIDVTVKRPDLRVRARQGYVAPPATSTKAAAAATLDTALGLALPVPGLTLRAAVTPLAAGPRGRTTAAVTLHVGYAAPDAGATRVKDELQYGLVAIEADGRVLASSRRAFSFELPLRQRGEVEYRINDAIDLPPGALTVRVGAASVAAGRAGTVHLPLVVPDFAAGRVEVSGLVIGLAGASESPASRFEAIAALTPIQPTAERTFTAADTLQVFARIFLPKDANERVDARLVVKRGDEVVRSESMAVESGRVDGRATADCGVELPLDGLSPGAYILEVTASAGNPAVRATAFQIQ